jgi:hypothetical protein
LDPVVGKLFDITALARSTEAVRPIDTRPAAMPM